MPDNGSIGAMVIAVAGALTAAGSAIKGITDVRTTKERMEEVAGEDGKGGLLAKLTKRVEEIGQRLEEVAELFDPHLRPDLDKLIERVNRYRNEFAKPRGQGNTPMAQSGSFPSIETVQALTGRLDDFDRRLKAAEERALRNEDRIDKHDDRFGGLDAFVGGARESLATIKAHLEHLLRGRISS